MPLTTYTEKSVIIQMNSIPVYLGDYKDAQTIHAQDEVVVTPYTELNTYKVPLPLR